MKLHAALIALTLSLPPAIPAMAGFSGDYTIYFHEGPTHERAGSYCMTFTNTANIDGFPDSGTWTAPDNSTGNFVVDGKMLRWYGYQANGDPFISGYNTIRNDVPGKGGYELWLPDRPPTPDGDGTTNMKARCQTR